MTKIMIVDDELDFREMLDLMMKKEGYETEMTVNGSDFLEKVEKLRGECGLRSLAARCKVDGQQHTPGDVTRQKDVHIWATCGQPILFTMPHLKSCPLPQAVQAERLSARIQRELAKEQEAVAAQNFAGALEVHPWLVKPSS